ncbi:hypothetical protein [Pararhodobacter aggregans]|uniref:RDD domain-containing protein n=1 Tax=Pararhodobacter aggregans TaxID=404875 RepID=A0A2T7UPD2_9RHOB|nr:hypothetical protein [Pararhodobacter aggregans]PTX01203.1 hypothetical protein C8N33_108162 [Pararhodobacter aggregans]PVE46585.1 hypothetical protein DDE23_15675 [Pararhodobacter aggregans]
MPPSLLIRRLAALALDLLIAGLVLVVLIAATPLGRVASLPLSPRLLGPGTCGPVTAETFADNPYTRLWIEIRENGQRDPSLGRLSPETSLCEVRIFGILHYAYFRLAYPSLLRVFPFGYIEIVPVDATGTIQPARDHTLALVAGLMLLAALLRLDTPGKRLLGLRIAGARPRLREALRSGPFLIYGLICALDPWIVDWLRPSRPPSEDRALIEAYLNTSWFIGTSWQRAISWALAGYALLALLLVALRRPAPWDRLAQTTVVRR